MQINSINLRNQNIKTNFSFQKKQDKTIPELPDSYKSEKPKKKKNKDSALFGIIAVAGVFLLGWYLSKKTPKV